MSASVVVRPTLNRTALRTKSGASPIATSVGDGSLDPLAQAVPVARQTPAKSAAIASACRSRPGNAIVEMCGHRLAVAAITTAGIPIW